MSSPLPFFTFVFYYYYFVFLPTETAKPNVNWKSSDLQWTSVKGGDLLRTEPCLLWPGSYLPPPHRNSPEDLAL